MVIDKALEAANELRILVATLNEKMVEATKLGITIDVSTEYIKAKLADGSAGPNIPLLTLDMTVQL